MLILAVNYLSNLFKLAGSNGIIIAEPATGLLSPAQCDEFSSQYVKRIVEAVQDDYFLVILHNCGNTVKIGSFPAFNRCLGSSLWERG